jgi:hypothetical protein
MKVFKVESLLDFDFRTGDFLRFTPSPDHLLLESNIRKLDDIKSRFEQFGTSIPESRKSAVYRKFIESMLHKSRLLKDDFDSFRDIKTLAWSLDYAEEEEPYNAKIIDDAEYLESALNLFQNKFSPSILVPLCEKLLERWFHPNADYLRKFILKHINDYPGKRKFLNIIKDKQDWFLDRRGALNLANWLLCKNIKIFEIWDELKFPGHTRYYQYFGELPKYYLDYLKAGMTYDSRLYPKGKIEDILEFLSRHNNKLTYKKVLSRIIVDLGSEAPPDYRDLLKNPVLENVGDPFRESDWYPWEGASTREKEDLKKAREIFNSWLNEEGIEIFFNIISREIDPEGFQYRKAFWLAYSKHIEYFKIAADSYLKNNLEKNEKIKNIVKERFAYLKNAESRQCAFIFQIKHYTFVEFAKTGGGFYAYLRGNHLAPKLDKTSYSINELRHHGEMEYLIRANPCSYNEEGRYSHQNSRDYYWQGKLEKWLDKVLGIKPLASYRVGSRQ